MPESKTHSDYVNIISNYVNKYLIEDERCFVMVDKPDSVLKPNKNINNFIPDLFYQDDKKIIIGEAKTDDDFDRMHSLDQYKSYIDECNLFKGEKIIVFCVSFVIVNSLFNIMARYKEKYGYSGEIIILDNFGNINKI